MCDVASKVLAIDGTTAPVFVVTGSVIIDGLIGLVTVDTDPGTDDLVVFFGAGSGLLFTIGADGLGAGTLLGLVSGSPGHNSSHISPFGPMVVTDQGLHTLFVSSGGGAGEVEWTVWYRPLKPGSYVAPA